MSTNTTKATERWLLAGMTDPKFPAFQPGPPVYPRLTTTWPWPTRLPPADDTVPGGRVRFARALRSPSFACLWGGQTISMLGDGVFTVALAWSVLQLTGSATALAEVLAAQGASRFVFLLIGGVIADRLPRRAIMFTSDAIRAAAVLLIAFLFWQHLIVLTDLIGLSILFGIADAFFVPAYQAIPPQLVPTDDLPSANSLNVLSRYIGNITGPAVGALLLGLAGPASAIGLDSLTFVISAACLLLMRVPRSFAATAPSPDGPTSRAGASSGVAEAGKSGVRGMLADIGIGFACLFGTAWLWVGTLVSSVGNIATATLSVALPKLVHSQYGQGVWLYGALLSASALGSIVASVAIGQVRRLRHRGVTAYLAAALTCAALAALGLPVSHQLAVYTSLSECALIGFGLGVFGVIYYTLLQLLVPIDKLGRVTSIDWLGSFALQPVGLALIGVLTDQWGPAPVFLIVGATTCALFLAVLAIPGIRNVDQIIDKRKPAPVLAVVGVAGSSGGNGGSSGGPPPEPLETSELTLPRTSEPPATRQEREAVLVTDDAEARRLEDQHELFQHALGGRLVLCHTLASIPPGARILDIACGTGFVAPGPAAFPPWLRDVLAECPDFDATGMDRQVDPLEMPLGEGRLRLVQADMLQTFPFPDASFDYVHQRQVGADVPADAWQKLVSEAVRVTKPGGWIELVEGGPAGSVPADCVAVGELVRVTSAWSRSRGIDLAQTGCLAAFLQASGYIVPDSLRSFDVPLALGAEVVWGAWAARHWLCVQRALGSSLLRAGFIADNGEYERLIGSAEHELRAASIPWPVHVAYAQRR